MWIYDEHKKDNKPHSQTIRRKAYPLDLVKAIWGPSKVNLSFFVCLFYWAIFLFQLQHIFRLRYLDDNYDEGVVWI